MEVAAVRKMSPALVRQRQRQEAIALADGQRAVTRCAKCPWHYRGTVGDGKKAFVFHWSTRHA